MQNCSQKYTGIIFLWQGTIQLISSKILNPVKKTSVPSDLNCEAILSTCSEIDSVMKDLIPIIDLNVLRGLKSYRNE